MDESSEIQTIREVGSFSVLQHLFDIFFAGRSSVMSRPHSRREDLLLSNHS